MKRRAFLGTALAGLPLTGVFAATPKVTAWNIPTTTLGRTGVRVQVVAQGGARMDLHPDIPSAARFVRELYDLGLRYFDARACTGTGSLKRRTDWGCGACDRTCS